MILWIWAAAIVIQLFITVFLCYQFTKYRKSTPNESYFISIIIAAHNERKNLERLIPALLSQEFPGFEIVISLDRTSDGSQEYLASIEDSSLKWLDISEIPEGFNEKKYALKEAITSAQGDWLVFTDADCLPTSNKWLKQLSSKMNGQSIVLGYSPYESHGSLLSLFIQYEAFVTGFHYLSMAIMGHPYMSVGRNMAIKKEFFLEKGGYDTFQSIRGGDDDLFIQKNASASNTSVVLGKNSSILTYPKKTWKAYINQKTRHLSVGGRYRLLDQLLHGVNNSTLLMVWALLPLLWAKNILLIALFYLFIKLLSYRFAHSRMGSGFNYILFPIVEFIYAIAIPMIALRSKLVKDIKWKN